MRSFAQSLARPLVQAHAFDLRRDQRRAMHFGRDAQHHLAAGEFLNGAAQLFAGGQIIINRCAKRIAQIFHIVCMKADHIRNTGNVADEARVFVAVFNVGCLAVLNETGLPCSNRYRPEVHANYSGPP